MRKLADHMAFLTNHVFFVPDLYRGEVYGEDSTKEAWREAVSEGGKERRRMTKAERSLDGMAMFDSLLFLSSPPFPPSFLPSLLLCVAPAHPPPPRRPERHGLSCAELQRHRYWYVLPPPPSLPPPSSRYLFPHPLHPLGVKPNHTLFPPSSCIRPTYPCHPIYTFQTPVTLYT